jgi:sarcosine oxidase subunit gamma
MAEQPSDPAFAMTELQGWSLTQLESRPDYGAGLEEALRRSWNLALPPRVGDVLGQVPVQAMRVAPDRVWILAESAAALPAAAAESWASALCLTHGRRRYRLVGSRCMEVLAKGIALDLDGSGLASGRAAQTQLHRVPVVLHRREAQSFDLFVPRSFSESLEAWLADAARETGWKPLADAHPLPGNVKHAHGLSTDTASVWLRSGSAATTGHVGLDQPSYRQRRRDPA